MCILNAGVKFKIKVVAISQKTKTCSKSTSSPGFLLSSTYVERRSPDEVGSKSQTITLEQLSLEHCSHIILLTLNRFFAYWISTIPAGQNLFKVRTIFTLFFDIEQIFAGCNLSNVKHSYCNFFLSYRYANFPHKN